MEAQGDWTDSAADSEGEFYWNENNFKPGIYTETKAE